MTKPNIDAYRINVRPLTEDEGGGFLGEIPDLPGCMGDGETPEEAIADVRLAAVEWIDACEKHGRTVPPPSNPDAFSGQWRVRVPKTTHERLALLAGCEGVSLNALVNSVFSEYLGGKNRPHPSQYAKPKSGTPKRK